MNVPNSAYRPQAFTPSQQRLLAAAGASQAPAPAASVPAEAAPDVAQPQDSYDTGQGRFNDFVGRDGYDPNFLGQELPMPKLSPRLRAQAAPLLADPSKVELKYTNFSVVQHAQRAMPMMTAVNIDGAQHQELDRKGSWVFDGRIAREHQMGNEAYKNNDFDRGHLVRRRDAQWGPDAGKASGDTFVYTNAALQHSGLNQSSWLDLENNILYGAVANKEKKTVFSGPILKDTDPSFDNNGRMKQATQIPTAFWKVQVWKDEESGALKSQAFLISQEDLIKGEKPSQPLPGTTPPPIKMYQIGLDELEKMTDIDFGPLVDGTDRTESDRKAIADAGLTPGQRPWEKDPQKATSPPPGSGPPGSSG